MHLQPTDSVLANLMFERRIVQIFRRVLPGLRLRPQFGSNFIADGLKFGFLHKLLQRAPLLLGIKVCQPARSVVGNQLFGDPPILLSRNVTGREMKKARVIRATNKVQNVYRSLGVGGERVAQIRIEIGQSRAVDDEIEILLEMAQGVGAESETRSGNVPLDNLDFFVQELEEPVSMPLKQRIEYWRVLHHLLETALGRIRFLPSNQQIDLFDIGQIHKRVRQPNLANETGDADQHHVLFRKCLAYRESWRLPLTLKMNDWPRPGRRLALGRNHCGQQGIDGNIQ